MQRFQVTYTRRDGARGTLDMLARTSIDAVIQTIEAVGICKCVCRVAGARA
jgi:hypothetical protein